MHCKVARNLQGSAAGQINKRHFYQKNRSPVKVYPKTTSLFPLCSGSTIRSVPTAPRASALIGRDAELATLVRLVTEVAKGRGGTVLIEGEPGIGKSALVQAALAEADSGCQVFWGAGDELGQALPLLPLLEALRVREPSANPRQSTIVRLLRGEDNADRSADVPAALATARGRAPPASGTSRSRRFPVDEH